MSDDFFSDFDDTRPIQVSSKVVPAPNNLTNPTSSGKVTSNTGPRSRRPARPPPPPRPVGTNAHANSQTTSSAPSGPSSSAVASSTLPSQQQRPLPKSLRRPNAESATNASSSGSASATVASESRPGMTPSQPRSTYNPQPSPPVFQQQSWQPAPNNSNTVAPSSNYTYYGSSSTSAPVSISTPASQRLGIPPAPSSGDWYAAEAQAPVNPMHNMHRQHFPSNVNGDGGMYGLTTTSSLMNPLVALEGSMDTNGASQTNPTFPTIFNPSLISSTTKSQDINDQKSKQVYEYSEDIENELPLLEELGINLNHILLKTKAVVLPFKFRKHHADVIDPALIIQDADLAGPLVFALTLGGELLLSGKLQFGYIYGFGVFGCLSMTLILNLISPTQAVSVWTVTSILGYSLLPVNILAALKILLVNLARLSTLGRLLGIIAVVWSTIASTRLLELGCGMRDQRYLMAYPIALLYSAFVLITIF